MHTELGADPAEVEFVVAGYGLAFAILLVTGGRLGDLFGRKRMFMLGMTGFTVASALCGMATTPSILVASRVFQGMTAAMMNPQVLALIRVIFPENERARAIGYFSTTLGLASIAAQLIGGLLIQADIAGLGWRPIFLVNVPIGIVALAAARAMLRESRAEGRPALDVGGVVLGCMTLLLLVYPLVEGREAGWPSWTGWSLAASVPCGAAFVVWEWLVLHRGRAPLVNLRLFRDFAFSLGLVMTMTFFSGLAAFFMGLTVFLQQGFGFSPLATGIIFVAFGIGFVGGSLVSAQVARRIGPRAISLGTMLMCSGLLTIVTMAYRAHGAPIDTHILFLTLIWYGFGQGLALPTIVASAIGSSRIPAQDAGSAAGVFSMIQQVAYALGVAVIVGIFFTQLGTATDGVTYEHALAVALACNAGLMAVTCALAFAMPRRTPMSGVVVHVE